MILKPFEEATCSMSGEKYITGSSVIIMSRCLKEACQKLIDRTDLLAHASNTVLLLKSGLNERFRLIEQSGTFALTTFLDPRFKVQGFADKSEAMKTKERVRKLVAAVITRDNNTAMPTVLLTTYADPDDLGPWNIFDKMVASSQYLSL